MKPSVVAVLVVVVGTAASGVSHAGDSAWLLCKGIGEQGTRPSITKTHFAASLLEHRGASDTRDLGVTLMYGDHVSRGTIVGKLAGDFTAKAVALQATSVSGKQPVTFTGTAKLSADLKRFTLSGKLDVTFGDDAKAALVPFTATLSCETLDDLAIGH